ncbi:hypothetical protein B0H17DRAFT_1092747 [Mycena rosella]|uniref:RNase III domain-containing protein n=1 Tax=Mycena rosella TaxID=1033263 RepID=A0AAD7CXM2_MYCRO|nr:hypothetical protein B0H17DRAFT_1092747 [Mycena rosella]
MALALASRRCPLQIPRAAAATRYRLATNGAASDRDFRLDMNIAGRPLTQEGDYDSSPSAGSGEWDYLKADAKLIFPDGTRLPDAGNFGSHLGLPLEPLDDESTVPRTLGGPFARTVDTRKDWAAPYLNLLNDSGIGHLLPPLPTIKDEDIRSRVFTHGSHFKAHSELPEQMQKLAFLGDADLKAILTRMLLEMYPVVRTNSLSTTRAFLQSNVTLAKISVKYKLPDHILSWPRITAQYPSVHADVFEAYIGGLHEDQGLERVQIWLEALFKPHIIEAFVLKRKNFAAAKAAFYPRQASADVDTKDTDSGPFTFGLQPGRDADTEDSGSVTSTSSPDSTGLQPGRDADTEDPCPVPITASWNIVGKDLPNKPWKERKAHKDHIPIPLDTLVDAHAPTSSEAPATSDAPTTGEARGTSATPTTSDATPTSDVVTSQPPVSSSGRNAVLQKGFGSGYKGAGKFPGPKKPWKKEQKNRQDHPPTPLEAPITREVPTTTDAPTISDAPTTDSPTISDAPSTTDALSTNDAPTTDSPTTSDAPIASDTPIANDTPTPSGEKDLHPKPAKNRQPPFGRHSAQWEGICDL